MAVTGEFSVPQSGRPHGRGWGQIMGVDQFDRFSQ